MKKEEEQFSPFGSYEKYTPKLKLPGITEQKTAAKPSAPGKKITLSKRDIIIIVLTVSAVAATLVFMLSPQSKPIEYTESDSWVIESASCNPQELQLNIRNFGEDAVDMGEWKLYLRGNEYPVILEESIERGMLKTLIFYFEQSNTMLIGGNSFRVYSPDMKYYDGECTI